MISESYTIIFSIECKSNWIPIGNCPNRIIEKSVEEDIALIVCWNSSYVWTPNILQWNYNETPYQ